MVLIDFVFDYKGACWADGFIPERPAIEKLYRSKYEKLAPETKSRYVEQRIRTFSDDDLMSQLVKLVGTEEVGPAWKSREGTKSIEDIFYLNGVGGVFASPEFSPLILDRHLAHPERYRQFIVVFDENFQERKACTKDLLKAATIKPMKKVDELDQNSYGKAARYLLDLIAEHYGAPPVAAERFLERTGFRVF